MLKNCGNSKIKIRLHVYYGYTGAIYIVYICAMFESRVKFGHCIVCIATKMQQRSNVPPQKASGASKQCIKIFVSPFVAVWL